MSVLPILQVDIFAAIGQVPRIPELAALGLCSDADGDDARRKVGQQVAAIIAKSIHLPRGVGGLDPAQYWEHAFAVAMAGAIVAETSTTAPELAYAAGLVHDVGKLILAASLPHEYEVCASQTRACGGISFQAERMMLGVDHCTAGSCAVRIWELPVAVATAVEEHHRPRQLVQLSALGRVTQAANCLAHALPIGPSEGFGPVALAEVADPVIGLDEPALQRCLLALVEQQQAIAEVAHAVMLAS